MVLLRSLNLLIILSDAWENRPFMRSASACMPAAQQLLLHCHCNQSVVYIYCKYGLRLLADGGSAGTRAAVACV
jgi:hypothetical protein